VLRTIENQGIDIETGGALSIVIICLT